MAAAEYAKKVKQGKLTLKHIDDFEKGLEKAGLKNPPVGPMILPDYTPDQVKDRQWNAMTI